MPPLGLNLKVHYEDMEFGGFVWRHAEHLGKWKELQSPSASRQQVTPHFKSADWANRFMLCQLQALAT